MSISDSFAWLMESNQSITMVFNKNRCKLFSKWSAKVQEHCLCIKIYFIWHNIYETEKDHTLNNVLVHIWNLLILCQTPVIQMVQLHKI